MLNVAGYHQKNAYMLKHWDAIQAGRAPPDRLLQKAERYFFGALQADPTDPFRPERRRQHPAVRTRAGCRGASSSDAP